MVQRLIEMILPEDKKDAADEILADDEKVLSFWHEDVHEDKILVKIVVDAEKCQTVIDKLKDNFSHYDEFRLLMFKVEASLPMEMEEERKEGEKEKEGKEKGGKKETSGVSREEIYTELNDQSRITNVYILLIILSSIVASIGLVKGDVAVIVGAMVIAPMLGPHIGLSLATTLADDKLANKAIKTALVGILISITVSILLGIFMNVDPTIQEMASRTDVGLLNVALALASGSAGALAYTKGLSSALIGVMVALALLPALATSGLLLGSSLFVLGMNALLLFIINLICINLAGVLTFVFTGFEPNAWWEKDKAKRMRTKAILLWITLLMLLIVGIIYIRYF